MNNNENKTDEQYINVKDKILKLLDTKEIHETFVDAYKLLSDCMNNIFCDIELAMKDELKQSCVDVNSLSELLKFIEKITLLQPMTDTTKAFIADVNDCIYNWNRNIPKNDDINHHIIIIDRAIKSMFTMGETINILKSLIKHLDDNELKDKRSLSNGLSHAYIGLLGLDKK